MTLTPEREEEVRKAWNETEDGEPWRCGNLQKWEWRWKYLVKARYFRLGFITAKGWDKEGM